MAFEKDLHNADDLHEVSSYALDHFDAGGGTLRLVITNKSNGTLPMLRVWRMWMEDIAQFKASRGSVMPLYIDEQGKWVGQRKFDAQDAHSAYTHLCLGCDEDGVRYSWSLSGDKHKGRKVASVGQRLRAMQKFHEHCLEHSVPIRIPENNEYSNLMEKQNQ